MSWSDNRGTFREAHRCPNCGETVPKDLCQYVESGAIYPCVKCGEPLILKSAPVLRP